MMPHVLTRSLDRAATIFVLVAIILFIQRRPRGLFPMKGRFVEA